MKHFSRILAAAGASLFCLAASAQISVDQVDVSQDEVKFEDKMRSVKIGSDYFSPARYRAERAAIRKERNYLEFKIEGKGTVTSYNETWTNVNGGNNSMMALGNFYIKHIFSKNKFSVQTEANAKFGYDRMKVETTDEAGNTTSDGVWFKSQDEFWIEVKPSFSLSKNWSYGPVVRFRSQFAAGYRSRTQQEPIHRQSTFMTPGYLDLSGSVTYKCHSPKFPITLTISPISLNATFVESDEIRENFLYNFREHTEENRSNYAELYGVSWNKTSRYMGGSSLQLDFERKFGKSGFLTYRTKAYSFFGWLTNLGMDNRIGRYADYEEAFAQWQQGSQDPLERPMLALHPTVNWENWLTVRAGRFLETSFFFSMRYDRSQNVAIQTQTILGLGVTYVFKNK